MFNNINSITFYNDFFVLQKNQSLLVFYHIFRYMYQNNEYLYFSKDKGRNLNDKLSKNTNKYYSLRLKKRKLINKEFCGTI